MAAFFCGNILCATFLTNYITLIVKEFETGYNNEANLG